MSWFENLPMCTSMFYFEWSERNFLFGASQPFPALWLVPVAPHDLVQLRRTRCARIHFVPLPFSFDSPTCETFITMIRVCLFSTDCRVSWAGNHGNGEELSLGLHFKFHLYQFNLHLSVGCWVWCKYFLNKFSFHWLFYCLFIPLKFIL